LDRRPLRVTAAPSLLLPPLKKGADPPKADGGFALADAFFAFRRSGLSRKLFPSNRGIAAILEPEKELAAEAAPTKSKSKIPVAPFFKGDNSKSGRISS